MQGFSEKVLPAFVPWCHHPVIPPNYKQSGLDSPCNLSQVKRNIQISPLLTKNDLFRRTQDVCLCMICRTEITSTMKAYFLNAVLPVEINSDGGDEENP